jgi:Cu2+-exporting ATPase
LKRLIVAAAAGMQVMMFAVALYFGDFFGIEGDIEKFLRIISLLVTVPVIFYSARPFYTAAWRTRRRLHNLPVSLPRLHRRPTVPGPRLSIIPSCLCVLRRFPR